MARFDGEIPGLKIGRPTLEDVYLRLTGQLGLPTPAAATAPPAQPALPAAPKPEEAR